MHLVEEYNTGDQVGKRYLEFIDTLRLKDVIMDIQVRQGRVITIQQQALQSFQPGIPSWT